MLVFYEALPIHTKGTKVETNNDGLNKNHYILGYRVPCYEKVKSSKLFVSSFPNWVKGHLNNDLDIFVGNQQYSGVTLDETNLDAIYPSYQEDGWYAMYPEGAVQFAENITDYDCW
jgi:hypothetical protein